MITLNTNLASMVVQSNLQKSTNALNTAIERMTSGYKINGAKDNAANYSITTNMSTKIGAYQVAEDNVAMGLDLLSTASENLDLISDKLTRLRALAEQSGTYGEQSKQAINAEANALVDEIERLYNTTEYNGIKLYEGEKPEGGHDAVIPADAKRVSEVTSFTAGKTYTLSSKEDLIALQDLTNSGKDTRGATFVMTSDIDMSGVSDFTGIGNPNISSSAKAFAGIFDGNDYVIENLNIKGSYWNGVFSVNVGEVKNLGVKNCSITSVGLVGGIAAVNSGTITNCYVTGNIKAGTFNGGLVSSNTGTITNCYAAATNGEGEMMNKLVFEEAPGGNTQNSTALDLYKNYTSSELQALGFTEANGWYTKDGYLPSLTPFAEDVNIGLQVGIDSSENSSINLTTSFDLQTVSSLRGIGKSDMDYLSLIDNMLASVSAKQTEYGAVQNRLDSSLEEISTQYENLVSSRSTLRDADIAEVSSEYIRQQILQQASATLLATANQSPSLALQLL